MARTTIYVYADWKQIGEPVLMGELFVDLVRGKETFSFKYDNSWLKSPYATLLDPDLQLYTFPQFLPDDEKELFGIFTDSCPDRWGRILMQRREFALARFEKRSEKNLRTSDYLLDVYDQYRMGGLRFKLDPNGPFLNDDDRMITPPMTRLQELQYISSKVEEDSVDDPDYFNWLNQLIAPGSSLGGARPKAGVIDEKDHLWIAKFPSNNDSFDVGAWEMVIHKMADTLNLKIPESRLMQFDKTYHTYLSKRFDRQGKDRIHFTSAMTMLGVSDLHEDLSYLDLANWIAKNCADPDKDLKELFSRMVFNVCVANVDDHLRNHGFLLGNHGWELSPVYDVNPSPDGTHLRLNISHTAGVLNLNLCLDVCEYFHIPQKWAKIRINEIDEITRSYDRIATDVGIPKNQILLMGKAFNKRNKLSKE